ncbi:hypothetical protein [Parasitella parasitica]|uniref:C3H1-type domain-containing protein n=1 Tax=Parasitella parasitica TaxID=35722 RepID=A0A0B7MS85_9FUNG|nr:hypothetical protein [Parasitella parasitica]
MTEILEKIVLLSRSATVITIVCGLAGVVFVGYVLFGKKKKAPIHKISTSRDIKQDVPKQDKAVTNDEVHTESKKASVVKVDKHLEASLRDAVKQEPFLAKYEATSAIVLRDAANYRPTSIDADIKREAMTANVEKSRELNSMKAAAVLSTAPSSTSMEPAGELKVSEPALASFSATTASITLEAQNLAAAPKPFLAKFDATTASALLTAREYITSLPKAPKPFLATYEATTASLQFEASQNIKNIVSADSYIQAITESLETMMPKVAESNPILAEYEATAAHCIEAAREFIASLVSSNDYAASLEAYQEEQIANSPQAAEKTLEKEPATSGNLAPCGNFAQLEATTALPSDLTYLDEPKSCKVHNLETKDTITTNLASLEATVAYQLLQQQKQQEEHIESDSDVEVEIDDNVLSSPSAVSSVSSRASSEIGESERLNNDKSLLMDSSKPQLEVSWDQMYASNNSKKPNVADASKADEPFMSTVACIYYPNCTNKKCKFVHPGNANNPKPKRAATTNSAPKKPWTKAERIERQSQTHFPTWKSRCVHWPYCTNNHCKYSHPIKECRMGEQCTFMERCMFLHPSDFMEPVKKRHPPKRAQTLPQTQTLTQV